ncbi:MAG: prephenate/arogenate dehydrogenase family protein [Paracoccus sp. (in: a-proteobacteria)]
MSIIYDKIALIGLGLIAGSISLAAREAGIAGKVCGTSRSAKTRSAARNLQICDEIVDNAAAAVRNADLIILCVPVAAMGRVVADIKPHLKPGAVITDVGSVKQEVIEQIEPHLPETIHFIPGHPLAGTEHSGPYSGFASLFQNRWWLLTPLPDTDHKELSRLRRFIRALGANVEDMDPAHHDLVLAVTSHTPHLIAYTMVGVADHLTRVTESEIVKYSAAGFRDFTRIAASDPVMWRDVFLTNKDAVLDILGRFTEELFVLQRAIRMGDGEHLQEYFTRTRGIRRGIIEAGQDTAAPDFGRGTKSMTEPPRES